MFHEPESKDYFVKGLVNPLYHKTEKLCAATLNQILIEHVRKSSGLSTMVLFDNKFYPTGLGPGHRVTPLHKDLRERMREYITETEAWQSERNLIKGYVHSVVKAASFPQDFLELLPVAMHRDVKRFLFCTNAEQVSPRAYLDEFLRKNEKYLRRLRIRLTYNLIDTR